MICGLPPSIDIGNAITNGWNDLLSSDRWAVKVTCRVALHATKSFKAKEPNDDPPSRKKKKKIAEILLQLLSSAKELEEFDNFYTQPSPQYTLALV